MSSPWQILGLEQGADRVEIRRAYARRLKQTNPEDDPQGFMALRQAYEWLLDHIEYEAVDFDDYRFEPASPLATAAADEAVAEPVAAGPWAAPADVDPDEVAASRILDELEAHLASSGNEGRQHSRELVARIMALPAMSKLSIASFVEHRLAHIIVQHPPHSDAIILQSVDAFGWTDQRRAHQFPFSGVIARLDEWRLIQALERPDDGLHKAWRLLTDQASAPVRWWNARMGRREQVAELLDYADYSAPGLVHSMDPTAAEWWRNELRQQRFPIEPILWQLAGTAVLYLTLIALNLPPGRAAPVAGGVFVAAVADMLLARRLLARLEWKHRPNWQYAAPIFAMLAVPPILLAVPLTMVTASVAVVLIIGLVWAARLLLFDPTGVPRERRWAVLLGLSAVAFLVGTADQSVPLAQFAVLVAVAWMLQLNLPMLRPAAAAVIDRVTRDWAWPALLLYALGMLVAAWVADDHGQIPLVRAGIAVFALYAAGGIAPFTARSIPPFVLGIMLVAGSLSLLGAKGEMTNDQVTNSASPGEALISIRNPLEGATLTHPQKQAKEALAEMSRRNPNFYVRITRLMDSKDMPKEAVINRINSEVETEVRRLSKLSSNKLIGDHQRLKADIANMLRKTDVEACAKFGFALNQNSDADLRSRVRKLQLAIVAHGPADADEKRDAPLPTAKEFDASRASTLRELEGQFVPAGPNDQKMVADCNSRVATAQALAKLSDNQLGTLARSAKE